MEEPSETKRSVSSSRLEAQWVVGFVDGEGCFFVGINKHPQMTSGFQILPELTVVQHQKDVQILHALKDFFGCGVVRINHGDRMVYRVRSLENPSLVQALFPRYPGPYLLHPAAPRRQINRMDRLYYTYL